MMPDDKDEAGYKWIGGWLVWYTVVDESTPTIEMLQTRPETETSGEISANLQPPEHIGS